MELRKKSDIRHTFSWDEKYELLNKTDYRCAHCGKKIGMINGCTVDHYIPLSKGGTNDKKNLVPLCVDCNRVKADSIYPPDWYDYLKDEYMDEIVGILGDFAEKTGFVGRNYFLLFDLMSTSTINSNGAMEDVYYKRANYSDLDEIYRLYKRYFRKYSIRKSDAEIKKWVSLVFDYGCFYINCEEHGYCKRIDVIVPIVSVGTPKGVTDIQLVYPYTRTGSAREYTLFVSILTSLEGAISMQIECDYYLLKVIIPKMDKLSNLLVGMSYVPPVRYSGYSIERVYTVSVRLDMHMRFDHNISKTSYSMALHNTTIKEHLLMQNVYTNRFNNHMKDAKMMWLVCEEMFGAGEINDWTFCEVQENGKYIGDVNVSVIDSKLISVNIGNVSVCGKLDREDVEELFGFGTIPVIWGLALFAVNEISEIA